MHNCLYYTSIGFELMFNYEFHAIQSKQAIRHTRTHPHTYIHADSYAVTAQCVYMCA